MKHNSISSCSFTIVNVYNPPKTHNSAIRSLLDSFRLFSNAIIIQGDFNLPSGIWDPSRNNSSPLSIELFNRLSDEDFGLVNDEGAPTWTNKRGSFSVLDLVFMHDSLMPLEPDIFVNLEGPGRSDHALLSLAFGTTEHWGRPYIPSGEEEEDRFIQDLASSINKRISMLPDHDVDTIVSGIGQDILDSWNRNSKAPRVGLASVTWWTADCQRAKDEYLASRTGENQKRYDTATKKATSNFFNRKIDLMTANDSPWEGVRWTKPRPPPKYSTILCNGKTINDPGARRSNAPSPPTAPVAPAAPQNNFTFADMVRAASTNAPETNRKPSWRAIETSKALVLHPSTKGTRVSELHLKVPKTAESADLFKLKGSALLDRIAKLINDHSEPAPRMALRENPIVFVKWSMRGNLVLKCAKPMDDLIKEGIKDAIAYFFPSPSAEVMILNKPPTTALKFLAVPRHNLDGSDTDDMDLLNDLTAHPAWANVKLWSNPKFINLKMTTRETWGVALWEPWWIFLGALDRASDG
ncbi:hypothetical protein AX14_007256 [Amanita brunnescens Koide BX004]|nr:hypothetical protein AX14_007256 [Amanita brunnescens Koide BX004]